MSAGPPTSPGAAEPAVETRELEKHYGGLAALDGVDLRIESGQSILLLGPNGAGKSTLLRTLATLLRPTRGSVRLWGTDPAAGDGAALRRRLGLLSHQSFLYDHLTAAENLVFYGRLYGLELDDGAVRDALRAVGLDASRSEQVRAFSRGMHQRLAIARAGLHQPDLVLLDEPFAGLDRQGVGLLQGLLGAAVDGGRTCLTATHDFAAALPTSTRVVILAAGRIVLDQTAAGLDPRALEALYREATRATRPAGSLA